MRAEAAAEAVTDALAAGSAEQAEAILRKSLTPAVV
jgi:hypothetical protein